MGCHRLDCLTVPCARNNFADRQAGLDRRKSKNKPYAKSSATLTTEMRMAKDAFLSYSVSATELKLIGRMQLIRLAQLNIFLHLYFLPETS